MENVINLVIAYMVGLIDGLLIIEMFDDIKPMNKIVLAVCGVCLYFICKMEVEITMLFNIVWVLSIVFTIFIMSLFKVGSRYDREV